MDAESINQDEASILSEMNSLGTSHVERQKPVHPGRQMMRRTSELQMRSNEMKMRMISGDKSVSMADVARADAEAKIAFDKSSILVKRISEGMKTILNTPL